MFSKGTRLVFGKEAIVMRNTINSLTDVCREAGFGEVFLPSIAPTSIWENRSGAEIASQMWTFNDKAGRDTCLVPEGTAMLQQIYRDKWSKELSKPIRCQYTMRAFRYERPQAGRYREFTQFGVEMLGPEPEAYEEECKALLRACMAKIGAEYTFDDEAVRGLSYYSRNGFEAACPNLGAQKQVAGGGVYAEGCGWAIGVDRLVLAQMT